MVDFYHVYVSKENKKKFLMLFKEYKKENDCDLKKFEYFRHLLDITEERIEEMEKGEREDIVND